MIRSVFILLVVLLLVKCRKQDKPPVLGGGCVAATQLTGVFLPSEEITAILNKYVEKGLPGITFIARKGDQYWQEQKGLSGREENSVMQPCLVWPAYSITKMYTATAILRLKEEAKLSLDQKISTCLPASVLTKVPDADKITIRMLLNHSSGIENFWDNPGFIMSYMDNPARAYTISDYLDAAQSRLFEAGTDAAYSNTNYLLLALIIDQVTGQSHAKAYEKYIFRPLNLASTYYQFLPDKQRNNIPQLYADIDNSGDLINYTDLSFVQFKNEYGSNSMLATPKDFVDFLYGLTHGKLLTGTTLTEMKTWLQGSNSSEIYGLGLEYYEQNGTEMYGHSGSSFGGRTLLLYIPSKDLTIFVGINASAELGGPVLLTIADLMVELAAVMTR